ncbi:hydroxymethylglutaryl-CoA lyase [Pontibacter sp. SGAir0037]|uniref:hydroxymethylglutaryl-CoA lyase n=1 Tax=Pontibacter sp. SGAir0037 TaxID=2571030 RepID=UPI0010CD359D|nr:hydroxymethylglutaryl-CoA lyase [Pontibacter sp. SGAir0037]QCR21699.1 hydroxymethylglutaryl-CoA lyase [Pontibacter sp. SGAir0037]
MKIIECPRDAMQGLKQFIPTQTKIAYLNQLLQVGFDTIDCGSFVSAKAIPQMQDTAEVLAGLDMISTSSKLLAIVANVRGAEEAVSHEQITYLGFPLSVSETFQQRNTNKSIAEAIKELDRIQELCQQHSKILVTYISMGFGNSYNDPWNAETVVKFAETLHQSGVKIISLSDTIGVSNPETITYLFKHLIPAFPDIEFGAHLHTTPGSWLEKAEAAYEAGCQRFDGAIRGFGGCPMANDELIGNMATENLINYFRNIGLNLNIDQEAFDKAMAQAGAVFS